MTVNYLQWKAVSSIFQAQYAISTLTTTFCYSHSDTLCCAWQEKMKNKREKKWYYVEAGASCSKGHKQNWIHPSLLRFFLNQLLACQAQLLPTLQLFLQIWQLSGNLLVTEHQTRAKQQI